MKTTTFRLLRKGVATLSILLMTVTPTLGQVIATPVVPLELPVEIETELAPAGSLKQAPLWHELAELLDNPSAVTCPPDDPATPDDESVECIATTARRRSYVFRNASGQPCAPGSAGCGNVPLPPLNAWSPCFNVLTGQPLRFRLTDLDNPAGGVPDGELSWDQPGLLFGPDDDDATTPLSDVIGNLVACPTADPICAGAPEGSLVVDRYVADDALLPPDGTVVAIAACTADGELLGVEDGELEEVAELEKPISELDLLRPAGDTAGVPAAAQPYIGRLASQVLGKALFWDMQVGSDGVQACASCHFHAGVDNRTKNQVNPNHLGGDLNFEIKQPNQQLVASDFPFHKLANPDVVGEPLMNPANNTSDSNDVASSMGVRFRQFVDIPVPGFLAFSLPVNGVRPLRPDVGLAVPDPIPGFRGPGGVNDFRRVEPRNTPTIFGAAFNFDNFWDGRARHDSNGGSVFGPADPQFHVFIDPDGPNGGDLTGATNSHFRDDLASENPAVAEQPVRIRFSSLASLATGPALSEFEMSFLGRNWAKLGKKLLQGSIVPNGTSVTPLANQLVSRTDSVLGPFSNEDGSLCETLGRTPGTNTGKPGLCVTYQELIRIAFRRELWHNTGQHFNGTPAPCSSPAENGVLTPAGCDPFDGYLLSDPMPNTASPTNTNQFRQIEANFSLFFGQSLQAWQQILLPDDSPLDRFMDANPKAANGVAQPGEQGTLPPNTIAGLVSNGPCPPGTTANGVLCLIPDNPATPWYDGFGAEELFGFDIFSGANLTAALAVGSARNPAGNGSNPFLRSARCMLCHLGPEQTDHTNNVNAGLLHSGTEAELPAPGVPEPTGIFRAITGIALEEEVEENAQDGVEVENRNFAMVDDPLTPWDDRVVGVPGGIAFQDNGVYNIGVRPTSEDIMRGGDDAFGWPLSLAALALKNLGGEEFEPCDHPGDMCDMATFDPGQGVGGGLFEETSVDQRINPGFEMEPAEPMLPEYLVHWANNLPAGEGHPEIDELSFAPGTITEPPFGEFLEILYGSDTNCGVYDPAQFGNQAPHFGWGPLCSNSQSAITNNIVPTLNGTWPVPNRVARQGAVKAPQLRNVELTGPYFHTGSYLTLRQIVDFYMRGGDFPITNAEDRDPNLVDVGLQAFGFGTTLDLPPQFQDGIPDTISQYGVMPDTTNPSTPEPASSTPESAKQALVKLLLAMTDTRVKLERAPFDHPEIIVPLDGRAPDNVLGRSQLLLQSTVLGSLGACGFGQACFKRILAVGAAGSAAPLPSFLGISSTPVAGSSNDHFDRR